MTTSKPLAPPLGRLLVKRGGHSITRQIPKPVVIIDTREKTPFTFTCHRNWIAGTLHHKLDAGDYSAEGMEALLALERKSLSDLITTLMQCRGTFLKECERLARYRWRAILVEASYKDIKSPYADELCTLASPNAVSGTLDAVEARFDIPVIYTSKNRALAEEKAASWLSKHFTYWYLEEHGLGRVLQTGDF
jgi:ERCC4-type nuclease